MAERDDTRNDLAQLRRRLDELRRDMDALEARLGPAAEGPAVIPARGLRRVRAMAGTVATGVAARTGDGVAALQDEVRYRPLASLAVVFLAGAAVGSFLAGLRGAALGSFLAGVRDAVFRETAMAS